MNKYKVKLSHLFYEIIDIEAEDKEQAREKVLEMIQKDDFKGQPQYETTLPPEHWPIVTSEEFEEMINKAIAAGAEKESTSNIITPSIITP
jgi:hypothetical protein